MSTSIMLSRKPAATEVFGTPALASAWLTRPHLLLDAGGALGLWVPPYVERSEDNLLIHANHQSLAQIKLVIERDPFEFDPRL